MEKPELSQENIIEMCDGHSDYGYAILACKDGGEWKEIYRTRYATNRMNEPTEGIFEYHLDRAEERWVVTIETDNGKVTLTSADGMNWR
jgi:beta-glucosidase/6-phospho-beta-glucosidase/beta-galactosidase